MTTSYDVYSVQENGDKIKLLAQNLTYSTQKYFAKVVKKYKLDDIKLSYSKFMDSEIIQTSFQKVLDCQSLSLNQISLDFQDSQVSNQLLINLGEKLKNFKNLKIINIGNIEESLNYEKGLLSFLNSACQLNQRGNITINLNFENKDYFIERIVSTVGKQIRISLANYFLELKSMTMKCVLSKTEAKISFKIFSRPKQFQQMLEAISIMQDLEVLEIIGGVTIDCQQIFYSQFSQVIKEKYNITDLILIIPVIENDAFSALGGQQQYFQQFSSDNGNNNISSSSVASLCGMINKDLKRIKYFQFQSTVLDVKGRNLLIELANQLFERNGTSVRIQLENISISNLQTKHYIQVNSSLEKSKYEIFGFIEKAENLKHVRQKIELKDSEQLEDKEYQFLMKQLLGKMKRFLIEQEFFRIEKGMLKISMHHLQDNPKFKQSFNSLLYVIPQLHLLHIVLDEKVLMSEKIKKQLNNYNHARSLVLYGNINNNNNNNYGNTTNSMQIFSQKVDPVKTYNYFSFNNIISTFESYFKAVGVKNQFTLFLDCGKICKEFEVLMQATRQLKFQKLILKLVTDIDILFDIQNFQSNLLIFQNELTEIDIRFDVNNLNNNDDQEIQQEQNIKNTVMNEFIGFILLQFPNLKRLKIQSDQYLEIEDNFQNQIQHDMLNAETNLKFLQLENIQLKNQRLNSKIKIINQRGIKEKKFLNIIYHIAHSKLIKQMKLRREKVCEMITQFL